MIDSYTNVIYGWKLTGDVVDKFKNEMNEFNEEWSDIYQNFFIEDYMCGNYIYFGAILGRFDEAGDGGEIIIESKLIKSSTNSYNKFIKDNPEIEKIIKKYTKKKPQLYVMQQKW